jgi:hypothetical protein
MNGWDDGRGGQITRFGLQSVKSYTSTNNRWSLSSFSSLRFIPNSLLFKSSKFLRE